MLNWYEQELRTAEIEQELEHYRQERLALLHRCRQAGWLNRRLVGLGGMMVAWGGRLQHLTKTVE